MGWSRQYPGLLSASTAICAPSCFDNLNAGLQLVWSCEMSQGTSFTCEKSIYAALAISYVILMLSYPSQLHHTS